jgi:hypothetical protein
MPRKPAAMNPDYQRAAVMAWGYFNERGPYMQTAFRDAIERHGRVFTDKKGAAMLVVLRHVVDGEDLPAPVAAAGGTPKGDEGLKALAVVMATALRSVPGAWEEFNEGAAR